MFNKSNSFIILNLSVSSTFSNNLIIYEAKNTIKTIKNYLKIEEIKPNSNENITTNNKTNDNVNLMNEMICIYEHCFKTYEKQKQIIEELNKLNQKQIIFYSINEFSLSESTLILSELFSKL